MSPSFWALQKKHVQKEGGTQLSVSYHKTHKTDMKYEYYLKWRPSVYHHQLVGIPAPGRAFQDSICASFHMNNIYIYDYDYELDPTFWVLVSDHPLSRLSRTWSKLSDYLKPMVTMMYPVHFYAKEHLCH